jgi:hypothetical protein
MTAPPHSSGKIIFKLNISGQAMVETIIILVLIVILFFNLILDSFLAIQKKGLEFYAQELAECHLSQKLRFECENQFKKKTYLLGNDHVESLFCSQIKDGIETKARCRIQMSSRGKKINIQSEAKISQ